MARENLAEALRRVEQNAGAPGIDGMSTKELRPWLRDHWPRVRSQLDAGTYRPQPVRRVMIPKPSGGERMLGVPTVVDRLICQAIAQVLTPVFDPHFHPHSFGYRPGRSQHDAVERARQFISDGQAWCADFDLDSFFDRVQHDALMARVARRVHDKQVLKLIRAYLEAGVMDGGLVHASEGGTPQGSPLSPLLSNVMLDDLDWELERRGHRFVRYADDGRIYVGSERAGQRVMESITQYVERRLKLKVNRQKSVVDRATKRTLLGFGFFHRDGKVKVRVDPKARRRRTIPPGQLQLVLDGQLDSTFAYSFIVTDIPKEEKSTAEVELFHRQRAQIEERFKDAKLGQALRHLPSGKLNANRLWLCCALLALNVTAWVCDISPAAGASGTAPEDTPLRRHAKTLRHLFFCVPARIVRTARRTIMRLPEGFPHFDLFNATYHAALALPGP